MDHEVGMTLRPSTLVDTNVVLRFLTRTPAVQAQAAARLFTRGQRGEIDLVLLPTIVAEVVYVLDGVYDYTGERVASELTALLDAQCLRVGDEGAVREALHRRATSGVDFVDAYLAAVSRREGVAVATFDRDVARLDVQLLPVG
jgi:predicted nucleic acid-binding protein